MFPLLTLNLYDNKYKRETLINEGLPYLKYIGHRVKKYRESIPFERVVTNTRGIFYQFVIPINCIGAFGTYIPNRIYCSFMDGEVFNFSKGRWKVLVQNTAANNDNIPAIILQTGILEGGADTNKHLLTGIRRAIDELCSL